MAESGTWLSFAEEILVLLDEAGFRDLAVEGGYTGRPASVDVTRVANRHAGTAS